MTDTLTTAASGSHANKSKLALFIHNHATAMDQLANIAGLLIGLSNIDVNEKNSALTALNDIKETAANHVVSADDIAAQIVGAATAPHVVLTPAGQPIPLLTTTAEVEAAQAATAKATRKAQLEAELATLGE